MAKLSKFITIPVTNMELAIVRKVWGSSPEKAAGLSFEQWALARILSPMAGGSPGKRNGKERANEREARGILHPHS